MHTPQRLVFRPAAQEPDANIRGIAVWSFDGAEVFSEGFFEPSPQGGGFWTDPAGVVLENVRRWAPLHDDDP